MTSNHRALDDSDIALIERVKLKPSLYDPRNSDFRLAYRKDSDWESVASGVGMTSYDARRRWTCLRDRYTRELKQLRMHPDKGDFGKNDFFLLMDFLRRFVRKRRVRRNTLMKYDDSFDGYSSLDSSTKIIETIASSEIDDNEKEDAEDVVEEQHAMYGDETRVFVSSKMVMPTNAEVSDEYPEYVEVDTSETYEEYIEPQTTEVASSDDTKSLNNSVIPIMLQQANETTYTLTTTRQQNVPASIQQQQKQQHHEQQQQTQLAAETTSNNNNNDTADDFFCKSIAAYLRQLSRRHKIKAKVEMFQILEKYIELEENHNVSSGGQKC